MFEESPQKCLKDRDQHFQQTLMSQKWLSKNMRPERAQLFWYNFNLLWGSKNCFRADGLEPRRSGVKVLIKYFWFSLRHPSARPEVMHSDTQQPRPRKDQTSQPKCQSADNAHVFISSPFTLSSPLLSSVLRFTVKMNVNMRVHAGDADTVTSFASTSNTNRSDKRAGTVLSQ